MKLILFLEFEGVLTTPYYDTFLRNKGILNKDDKFSQFDPVCAENLNKIIDVTAVDIVVLSAFSFGCSLEELQEMWKKRGMHGNIIGMTPAASINGKGMLINEWLKFLDEKCIYAILDSDLYSGYTEEQRQYLVQTRAYLGLTCEVFRTVTVIINQLDFCWNIKLLEELAEKGATHAMNKLARCYRDGDFVEKSEEKYRKYLEMSCSCGDDRALLEIIWDPVWEEAANIDKKVERLLKAVESGSTYAVSELINLYDKGEAVAISPEKIQELREKKREALSEEYKDERNSNFMLHVENKYKDGLRALAFIWHQANSGIYEAEAWLKRRWQEEDDGMDTFGY